VKILPAYFDASVLAKTYVRETGSARGRQLVRTRQVITSSITALELMSAFRRNLAAGSIDEKGHTAIVKRFRQHREKLRYVEPTSAVLENAEKYVSDFNIRALDAIHIASAMVTRGRFPKDLPFITADSRQREVALRLGFQVIWTAE
jgi:predicted nucleic acid-binding protein